MALTSAQIVSGVVIVCAVGLVVYMFMRGRDDSSGSGSSVVANSSHVEDTGAGAGPSEETARADTVAHDADDTHSEPSHPAPQPNPWL